jgi:hypothetical protein
MLILTVLRAVGTLRANARFFQAGALKCLARRRRD